MKWKTKCVSYYYPNFSPWIKFFAILPRSIDGMTYWLEYLEYRWCYEDAGWDHELKKEYRVPQ